MSMLVRTIKLRLRPDAHQETLLMEARQAVTDSFNQVCSLGWKQQMFNGVTLHKATYQTHRQLFNLPSQLAISARMKATEALLSARDRQRKGKKVSCPHSECCPVRYDQRSYSVWFERSEVSLLTLQGRVRLSFRVAPYYAQYTVWSTDSAELMRDRKGRWWLHVVVSTPPKEVTAQQEPEQLVGVDLGIVSPAVDSRGWSYGAEHWKDVQARNFKLRRELQSKGTRSAKRKLKRIAGRERRFRRDCDHVLSKRLVQSMAAGETLVFEDLTHIRGRVKACRAQRRRLHSWSFAQLQDFVKYKAEAVGIQVALVDPRYTSQTCSQCQYVSRSNRPEQAVFKCRQCGFKCHADYNAALNIRANHLKSKGLPVNQPIVAIQEITPFELVTSSGL
ncbi:MAG: transposase [Candidatus Melainabacteria bacterium HGW-Melainabacteria-1]|nr:MAG: transposase [Candidatus Melainabacteria bacterium HGW-Melainabacteria-1]